MTGLTHLAWKFPSLNELAQAKLGAKPVLECRLSPPQGRSIVLKSPLLLRQIPWNFISKENAIALCGAARQIGAAVAVPISILEQLPASSIPLRIAQIWTNRSPALDELEMSDLIEFNFCTAEAAQAELSKQFPNHESIIPWPVDVADSLGLKHRIIMLREVTEYKIPIGFAISAGHVHQDITLALECEVDYIVLCWSPSFFDAESLCFPAIGLAQALLEAQAALSDYPTSGGKPKPKIFVDSPLASDDDFAKLFALGADGWAAQSAIDGIVRQSSVPSANPSFGGMLANYPTPSRPTSIQPQLSERLQKYVLSLEYILARAGKSKSSELSAGLLCECKV